MLLVPTLLVVFTCCPWLHLARQARRCWSSSQRTSCSRRRTSSSISSSVASSVSSSLFRLQCWAVCFRVFSSFAPLVTGSVSPSTLHVIIAICTVINFTWVGNLEIQQRWRLALTSSFVDRLAHSARGGPRRTLLSCFRITRRSRLCIEGPNTQDKAELFMAPRGLQTLMGSRILRHSLFDSRYTHASVHGSP